MLSIPFFPAEIDSQHQTDVSVLIKAEDKFISVSHENVFQLPVLLKRYKGRNDD